MKKILVFDLGATKCAVGLIQFELHSHRFELVNDTRLHLRDFDSFAECIEALEAKLQFQTREADAICFAAAGRYHQGEMNLEHGYPYPIPIQAIATNKHWQNFDVVHDYTPIACATFTAYSQSSENLLLVNDKPRKLHGRRVVLGIGTGLGVKDCVLLNNDDFWFGANEAGHIGIPTPPKVADPAILERHEALIHFLSREGILAEKEGISFESILSGKGLERLYRFCSHDKDTLTAAQICEQKDSALGKQTFELFAWYLGLYVGGLQCLLMPAGGMWLAGGVLRHNTQVFEGDAFFEGLAATPAYLDDRQQIAISMMIGGKHVFYGGAYYASRRLLGAAPVMTVEP